VGAVGAKTAAIEIRESNKRARTAAEVERRME